MFHTVFQRQLSSHFHLEVILNLPATVKCKLEPKIQKATQRRSFLKDCLEKKTVCVAGSFSSWAMRRNWTTACSKTMTF